ncbi:MAG: DUF3822 family protein [Bacteroidales bacterium]|nr:DUF3822 family protein [Bacteroidales bacterium]
MEPIITQEMIGDSPRMWRLYLRVGPSDLHVMLYNIATDNMLIHRQLPLNTAEGLVKGLEQAVYDNPALLGDFSRVEAVVETNRFTLIPNEITDDETRRRIYDTVCPSGDNAEEVVYNDLPGLDCVLAWGADAELIHFLRRTFNNPRLHCHLAPLCRYFHDKSRIGNSGKMYAHLRQGAVDIMSFGRDTVRIANTYPIHDTMDAAYYIIAARKALDLNPQTDELLLAGDARERERLMPVLREYLAYVMPAIFPSLMYKAGKEALDTPFDLIVLPLCE